MSTACSQAARRYDRDTAAAGGLGVLQTPRLEGGGFERMVANTDGGVLPEPSKSLTTRRSTARPTALPHDALGPALERTADWLLERQTEAGYWVGELEGDTILESEYILLLAFLGRESDPVCRALARYIQDHQLVDGGWAIYPGGPTD